MSKARDLSLRHAAVTKATLGLDNVENHSTATIRSGVTATDVGLGNVENTALSSYTVLASNLPTGTIIHHQQFKSTAGQDVSGTTETVYTGLGTMTFSKKKDASTSKLFFHSHGKMFDSVGSSLSMGFKLRKGTNTSGTIVGGCDAYDLYHSTASPWRTGRDLSMACDEVTDLGVGNHDFVITCTRNGYSDPQHCAYWHLHIFEIAI